MDIRLPLAAAGLFTLFGQSVPPETEPVAGWLRLLTPAASVQVVYYPPQGDLIEFGETGLIAAPLRLPAGTARICLEDTTLQTLCRDIEIRADEETTWVISLQEFPGWRAKVRLPKRVVAVEFLTRDDSGTRVEDPARKLAVYPEQDYWLVMYDEDGQRCLCHTPPLAVAEVYECWWPCLP